MIGAEISYWLVCSGHRFPSDYYRFSKSSPFSFPVTTPLHPRATSIDYNTRYLPISISIFKPFTILKIKMCEPLLRVK